MLTSPVSFAFVYREPLFLVFGFSYPPMSDVYHDTTSPIPIYLLHTFPSSFLSHGFILWALVVGGRLVIDLLQPYHQRLRLFPNGAGCWEVEKYISVF